MRNGATRDEAAAAAGAAIQQNARGTWGGVAPVSGSEMWGQCQFEGTAFVNASRCRTSWGRLPCLVVFGFFAVPESFPLPLSPMMTSLSFRLSRSPDAESFRGFSEAFARKR
jgi:hypothetical protein